MYLTGGQFKGHKIEVPKNTKPTLSKVRESVFNILQQFDFESYTFLDMFAGSAIMGLEAVSRGYNVCEFEINPKTAQIIKKNYEKIKQKPQIIITDSLKFVTDKKFDIIYIDPPWDMDYAPIIYKAYSLLSSVGVIIIEYDKQKAMDLNKIIYEQRLKLQIIKSKKYGRCLIDILKKSCWFI